MKLLLKTLFICILLGFTSCNQSQLGALTAVKNAVKLPFTGIKNHFSNKAYDRIPEANTLQLSSEDPGELKCGPTPENLLPLVDGVEELSDASRDLACSCKAWGSCSSDVCSCNQLCPKSFEIFKKEPLYNITNDLTYPTNSLSFRNADALEKSSINGSFGYCWGHASVTSKFTRLAFFDPSDDSLKKQLDSPPNSLQRKYAIQEYKKIIDDIVDNKVKTIPGFTNLHELSDHPDLETYIADKVARSWADRAMSMQGMLTALQDSPMKKDESQELFSTIEGKIKNFQQPQIVFTEKGNKFKTHAVLVSHIEVVDGKKRLCIRDNNLPPFTNLTCQNYMVTNDDGGIVYNDGPYPSWGELGSVKLAHNDNPDALEQYHSLRTHCSETKDCPL